jgi:hypothetical protein
MPAKHLAQHTQKKAQYNTQDELTELLHFRLTSVNLEGKPLAKCLAQLLLEKQHIRKQACTSLKISVQSLCTQGNQKQAWKAIYFRIMLSTLTSILAGSPKSTQGSPLNKAPTAAA